MTIKLLCLALLIQANIFGQTYYPIIKNGKVGYIDSSGKIVIDAIYPHTISYYLPNATNNFFVVNNKEKMSVIYNTKTQKQVFNAGKEFPYIDYKNKLFIKVIGSFENGYWNSAYDFNGKLVIDSFYYDALNTDKNREDINDNRFPFEILEKFGFKNRNNKIIIQVKYHYIDYFSNGYCAVQLKKDGLYGYINTKGEMVIKPQFIEVEPFLPNGIAKVRIVGNDYFTLINTKGVAVKDDYNLTNKAPKATQNGQYKSKILL